jgi:ketosteroid isomerase-like protein
MNSQVVDRQSPAANVATQRAPIPETRDPAPANEDPKTAATRSVIDRHLKCFGEGDLPGILADYAPGAVLFTPAGPLKGEAAIRPLFEAMIAEFGKPGAAFTMKQQFVEADSAYILWTAETADNVYELGTDTFVVRDGRIVVQSFTSRMTPKD